MSLHINPGSGTIEGGTLAHAETNMAVFMFELGKRLPYHNLRMARIEEWDVDGRFAFVIESVAHCAATVVEMPGIPLAEVHHQGLPTQHAWEYMRLYVNSSSWLWFLALDMVVDDLGPEDA